VDDLLEHLVQARREGRPCALATVAATTGSVPRHPGAKMIVHADGSIVGTVGGGKFESLVIAEALECLAARRTALKAWPLREDLPGSFGAICGGEVTVLIEPSVPAHALFLVGGGHCAQAIARLAAECGFHVTAVDDRPDVLNQCTAAHARLPGPAPDLIRARVWSESEAIVIVSRHYDIDREALAAALQKGGMGYIGMIGSNRKVLQVFDHLKKDGVTPARLGTVHAPLGLDIGADSPAEIAVSVMAEVLMVLRGRSGAPLKLRP
jgi:xanthine dehydrogenase accessory factor